MPGLFDGFVGLGRTLMNAVDAGDPEAVRYKRLLGEISALFADTHSLVLDVVERMAEADSGEEVSRLAAALEDDALRATFRAEGLCETFQAFGDTMRAVVESHGSGLPAATANDVHSIGLRLSDREREVAQAYVREVQALADLQVAASSMGLDEVKRRAALAADVLTAQIADFEALRDSFRGLRRR